MTGSPLRELAIERATHARPAVSPRLPLWVLGLLVVMAFAFQGTRGIWEPDEGRYSAVGMNMHESGDWLVPTLDRVNPHLTKPPMTYWALAASFGAFGHNEWAARLPSALAFVGTGLLVFGLGRRLCPGKPWLPVITWSLSLGPLIAANVVSTDPILAFFETAAMYAFVEARFRAGNEARSWYVAMWAAWGLAFLTKGPPGLLPLVAMVVFLAIHDRHRLKALFAPVGLALFALVGLTWFILLVAQQPDRLDYFLGYEVRDRIFTGVHDRNSEWYGGLKIYVPVLLGGALPWSVLAIIAVGGPRAAWQKFSARLRERRHDWLLLTYWLLVPLAVFFLARSRLHLYLLPLFVPLALMIARPIATWPALSGRRLGWVAALTAACLLALKALVAHWPNDRDSREIARQFLEIVDPASLQGIVFVNMHPYYGLDMYLDLPVHGIQVGIKKFDRLRVVPPSSLCDEVRVDGRIAYATRKGNAAKFSASLVPCGVKVRHIGNIVADDQQVFIYIVEPRGNEP